MTHYSFSSVFLYNSWDFRHHF